LGTCPTKPLQYAGRNPRVPEQPTNFK